MATAPQLSAPRAGAMTPLPFRVAGARAGHRRHVDADARARSRATARRSRPGQFMMVYVVRDRRGADLGQRPARPARAGRADGARRRRGHAARSARSEPGAVLGLRGPFGNVVAGRRGGGRRRGRGRRRDRARAASPGRPARARAPRRLRRASRVLYGARTPARPALPGAARGVARRRSTSRSPSTPPARDWAGPVGVVAKLVARRDAPARASDRVRLRARDHDATSRSRRCSSAACPPSGSTSRWSATWTAASASAATASSARR